MSEAVLLGSLMASDKRSIDPRRSPDEVFELYSIPAFDAGAPIPTRGAEIGSPKQVVLPGDVLLSKIVPHIRRAWVVPPEAGQRAVGSSEWIIFRGDGFYPPYLRHALVSDRFHTAFMATVAGVGGSLLRARPAHVANIRVPLPSIEEQRRIAAVLDEADELRAKRQASLALVDSLNESIFLDMFGEPVGNPRGWQVVRLADVSREIQIGPFGSLLHQSDYVEGGVPLVNPMHIVNDRIIPDSRHAVGPDKLAGLRRYVLSEGDIVLARRGEMGRCAVVDAASAGMVCGSGSLYIRPDDTRVDVGYLHEVLTSAGMKAHLERKALGVTMANLNGGIVGELPIPLPPRNLQQRFASATTLASRQRELLTSSSWTLDELFASLQHRAFAGQL